MPKWTAGLPLPGMGGALTLSVLAHALALAWWLHANQIEEGAPSVGQKRGQLTVTIAPSPQVPRPVPQQRDEARPHPTTAKPATRPHVAPDPAEVKAVAVAPDVPALPQPSPMEPAAVTDDTQTAPAEPQTTSAPTPPAAKPPEAPGARFANLFAPIISRPLGRGRWQAPPSSQVPEDMSAAMQREQAIQGLRQALAQRVDALRPSLQQTPLTGHCDIRISLDQRAAQLDCTDAADLQRLSPLFGALVTLQATGTVHRPDSCLAVQQRDLQWQACPAHAGAAPTSHMASEP